MHHQGDKLLSTQTCKGCLNAASAVCRNPPRRGTRTVGPVLPSKDRLRDQNMGVEIETIIPGDGKISSFLLKKIILLFNKRM